MQRGQLPMKNDAPPSGGASAASPTADPASKPPHAPGPLASPARPPMPRAGAPPMGTAAAPGIAMEAPSAPAGHESDDRIRRQGDRRTGRGLGCPRRSRKQSARNHTGQSPFQHLS